MQLFATAESRSLPQPNLLWQVIATSTPAALRRCGRCGALTPHACTNKFRINSQKRVADAWLIYKCAVCNSSWNCTILSRVGVDRIDGELLENMLANDELTARRYAFDHELLRRNGARVADDIAFRIEKHEFSGGQVSAGAAILIRISPQAPLRAELCAVLAAGLDLSRSQVRSLAERGAILDLSRPEASVVGCVLRRDILIRVQLPKE